MRFVWLLILSVLVSALPVQAVEWTLLKHDGREYISFDNMAEFYGLSAVRRNGSSGVMTLGNRSLRGEQGSPDFYINNLKFILSYPVAEIGGKLCVSRMDLVKIIEPVLRPSKITASEAVDTIILDPGHGGHDLGAGSVVAAREKDYTLDTANRARLRLTQAGFKVYMTRTTDVFIPLEDRVAFANKFPNALFVSIHFNSSGAGTGIETYTLAPRGVPSMMADGPRVTDAQECKGNCRDAENIALATATHASLIVHSHMPDRGIKRARFVVIRDITIPGVLIEGGFLSNGYDARMIAQPAYRETLAASIVEASLNYRTAVAPPGTPPLARNDSIVIPPLGMPDARGAALSVVQAKAQAPTPAPKKTAATISSESAVAASAARVQLTN
ncbi:MAG TPA: N-acetylmuramoyl-L-alanine amidase [Chthoniobacteraceae bacterium]|jgi:N-acetylmuramoyl-L-alanine amidase|nr:N-acetylmuramoyl-L-alanine amidase [Chthoniobacteraceae bacterium]